MRGLVAALCLASASALVVQRRAPGLTRRGAAPDSKSLSDEAVRQRFAASAAQQSAKVVEEAVVASKRKPTLTEIRERESDKYQLRQSTLLGDHAFICGLLSAIVVHFGSLHAAESYAIGSLFGWFYLYLLGRFVGSLGVMTYEAVGNSGVAQARFAIIGLLVLLAGKNRDVIEFLPLFGGFFTYQISTFARNRVASLKGEHAFLREKGGSLCDAVAPIGPSRAAVRKGQPRRAVGPRKVN